jgi:hypothetical protein
MRWAPPSFRSLVSPCESPSSTGELDIFCQRLVRSSLLKPAATSSRVAAVPELSLDPQVETSRGSKQQTGPVSLSGSPRRFALIPWDLHQGTFPQIETQTKEGLAREDSGGRLLVTWVGAGSSRNRQNSNTTCGQPQRCDAF